MWSQFCYCSSFIATKTVMQRLVVKIIMLIIRSEFTPIFCKNSEDYHNFFKVAPKTLCSKKKCEFWIRKWNANFRNVASKIFKNLHKTSVIGSPKISETFFFNNFYKCLINFFRPNWLKITLINDVPGCVSEHSVFKIKFSHKNLRLIYMKQLIFF